VINEPAEWKVSFCSDSTRLKETFYNPMRVGQTFLSVLARKPRLPREKLDMFGMVPSQGNMSSLPAGPIDKTFPE
jgi:hypothetical protein